MVTCLKYNSISLFERFLILKFMQEKMFLIDFLMLPPQISNRKSQFGAHFKLLASTLFNRTIFNDEMLSLKFKLKLKHKFTRSGL